MRRSNTFLTTFFAFLFGALFFAVIFGALTLPGCVQGNPDSGSAGAGLTGDEVGTVCGGESVACFMLDAETCDTADGCATVGACTGYAARCGYWRAQGACEAQDGCDWTADDSEDGGSCGGVVTPCDRFVDPASCADQLNCHWELFCGGFATSCEERPAGDCEAQPGCSVDD